MRKFAPDSHTALDRSNDVSSTPLCWIVCHSLHGRSSGWGSDRVGSGAPSTMRNGSAGCLGGGGAPSVTGGVDDDAADAADAPVVDDGGN